MTLLYVWPLISNMTSSAEVH